IGSSSRSLNRRARHNWLRSVWPCRRARMRSGALINRAWNWVVAPVRSLTAGVWVTSQTRIASTSPSPPFGAPGAGPARPARGGPGRGPGGDAAGGCFGVERVGLAVEPASLAVGSIDLDHFDTLAGEEPAQASPVAPSRLASHSADPTVAFEPFEQRRVAR